MTDQMPQVNAEFGTTPVIEFRRPKPRRASKVVELTEGDGPIVRRGDTVTVNHGVVWGKDDPIRLQLRPSSARQFRHRRGTGHQGLGPDCAGP